VLTLSPLRLICQSRYIQMAMASSGWEWPVENPAITSRTNLVVSLCPTPIGLKAHLSIHIIRAVMDAAAVILGKWSDELYYV
jgi:hypothetical protein